jgi:hypothetical protein
MQSKVICVLGMHRSGTSCLTGTLEEAGVYLGEVIRQARFNARGNRENRGVITLHNALLAANGGSWDNPPEQVRWSSEHRRMQQNIIRDYADQPLWGFKDPRALFALDGWLAAIPHLTLVGMCRHPWSVAQSLQHRDQFALDKGLDLWLRYNQRLLHYHARFGFPILSFDWPEPVLREELAWLLHHLGLPAVAKDLQFFDPELRHQQSPAGVSLPANVTAVWQQLCHLAQRHSEAA